MAYVTPKTNIGGTTIGARCFDGKVRMFETMPRPAKRDNRWFATMTINNEVFTVVLQWEHFYEEYYAVAV